MLEEYDKLLEAGVQVSCLMVMTKNAIGKGYHYLEFFEKRGFSAPAGHSLRNGFGVYGAGAG